MRSFTNAGGQASPDVDNVDVIICGPTAMRERMKRQMSGHVPVGIGMDTVHELVMAVQL